MESVQEYKELLMREGIQLIYEGIPEKIILLNQILQTPQFHNFVLADIHLGSDLLYVAHVTVDDSGTAWPGISGTARPSTSGTWPDTKHLRETTVTLPIEPVPCNRRISELIGIIKSHIRGLVEDTNFLKLWISVMIPKIEDGDNFGVSVQETTLAEIQTVETETGAIFDQITQYYMTRADIISKVARYPYIVDYQRAVRELDEKQYLSLTLVMAEIRNRYSILHDAVVKNIDRILTPRSTHNHFY